MKLEGSLPCRVAGTLGFPSLGLSCLSLSGGGCCRCSTSQPGPDVLLLLLLPLLLLLLLLPERKTLQSAEGTPDRALARSCLPEPECSGAAKGWRAGRAPLRRAGSAGPGGDQYKWKVLLLRRRRRRLRSVPGGIWGGCARLGEGRGAGVPRPWGKGGRGRGLGAAELGPAGGEG